MSTFLLPLTLQPKKSFPELITEAILYAKNDFPDLGGPIIVRIVFSSNIPLSIMGLYLSLHTS